MERGLQRAEQVDARWGGLLRGMHAVLVEKRVSVADMVREETRPTGHWCQGERSLGVINKKEYLNEKLPGKGEIHQLLT